MRLPTGARLRRLLILGWLGLAPSVAMAAEVSLSFRGLTLRGELVLAEVNLRRYRELARAKIFDNSRGNSTRALPALAGGRLYVRDTRTLKCLDLQAVSQ